MMHYYRRTVPLYILHVVTWSERLFIIRRSGGADMDRSSTGIEYGGCGEHRVCTRELLLRSCEKYGRGAIIGALTRLPYFS